MAGEDEFDIVVIGGGPGGYATALYGAAAGLSVAIVERDKVGGTCLHRGCIPAKEFLETAAVYRTVEGAKEFGIGVSGVSVDFSVSQDRKNAVVDKLHKGLAGLLKGRKVTTLIGHGHPPGGPPGGGGRRGGCRPGASSAATSSWRPGRCRSVLPGFEVDGRWVMTSDEFLDLKELPASVAVIGGGVIGCEFASLLADLGSKVTILEALDTILPGCDDDIVRAGRPLLQEARDRHRHRRQGRGAHAVDGRERSRRSRPGTRPSTWRRSWCRWAGAPAPKGWWPTGWASRSTGAASWRPTSTSAPASTVSGPSATSWPAPRSWPTSGSPRPSWRSRPCSGEPVVPVDNGKVPWAIYCHPEVAFCGMTEAQAKEAGIPVVTKKDPFGGNSRAQIIGDTEGVVKIIAEQRADGTAGRILGVHLCGPWVTEQLGAGYLAVNWEAFPEEVAQFIQPHPSLSETFGETMLALTGRGLHVG